MCVNVHIYIYIYTGYKTGARYSQNASVKGSGRVPKSVHSPVISSTKKRSDIGVACTNDLFIAQL